jgi:hypothetical protein
MVVGHFINVSANTKLPSVQLTLGKLMQLGLATIEMMIKPDSSKMEINSVFD